MDDKEIRAQALRRYTGDLAEADRLLNEALSKAREAYLEAITEARRIYNEALEGVAA